MRLEPPVAIRLEQFAVSPAMDGTLTRTACQTVGVGSADGDGEPAGECFSLAAGTGIAPLLVRLRDDTCHAPHWGYVVGGGRTVALCGRRLTTRDTANMP